MVLQKVGEYLTTINVNGKEKVSTLQSEDTTYDITDAQQVDIEVNNTNEGSFSQTGSGRYNVDAEATLAKQNTVNVSHSLSVSQDNFSDAGGTIAPAFLIVNNEVTLSAGGDFAEASCAGTTATDNTSNKTITVSGVNTYTLNASADNVGGSSSSASVSYTMYTSVNAALSVNSVIKQ